nr:mucin-2-like [Dermacentor andersoni]
MALLRFQLPLTWLTLAYITCTLVSKAQPVDESGDRRKCERAFPSSTPTFTFKCTYKCKGWNFRFENEPDGIPCGVFAIIRRTGVCRGGKCVSVDDFRKASHGAVQLYSTTVSTEQTFPTVARVASASNITSDVPSTVDMVNTARITKTVEELVTKLAAVNSALLGAEQRTTSISHTEEWRTTINEGLTNDDINRSPNDANAESSTLASAEHWAPTASPSTPRVNATSEVLSTEDTVTTARVTKKVEELVTKLATVNSALLGAELRTSSIPHTEEPTTTINKGLTNDDVNRSPKDTSEESSTLASAEHWAPTASPSTPRVNATSEVLSTEDTVTTARVTKNVEELVTKLATVNSALLGAEQRTTSISHTEEPTTTINQGLTNDDVNRSPNDTSEESSTLASADHWAATASPSTPRVNATSEVLSTEDTVTTAKLTTGNEEVVTELSTTSASILDNEYQTTQVPSNEKTTTGKIGLLSDYAAPTQGRIDGELTSAATQPGTLTQDPTEESPTKPETILPSSITISGSHIPILYGGIQSTIFLCSLVCYARRNLL